MKPAGSGAVMNARATIPDALDDFPTPPWATRALPAIVLPALGFDLADKIVWEPAANRLNMALPLAEAECMPSSRWKPRQVWTSDIFNYGAQLDEVGSFIASDGLDLGDTAKGPPGGCDWVISNFPFNVGLAFALKALQVARVGVACLMRSNWLEGQERYEELFNRFPLIAFCPFVERVPMVEGGTYAVEFERDGEIVKERRVAFRGGYDPEASTATSYGWFVFHGRAPGVRTISNEPPRLLHIPPCRERLTMPDDAKRFGKIKEAPHGA